MADLPARDTAPLGSEARTEVLGQLIVTAAHLAGLDERLTGDSSLTRGDVMTYLAAAAAPLERAAGYLAALAEHPGGNHG